MNTEGDAAERMSFADDGTVPNNPGLAVRLYRAVLTGADLASGFEGLFAGHGWTNSWRDGIYDFHHFHSTAHEVLGVSRGEVTARIGGEAGTSVTLRAGDAMMLPAGTGHKRERGSADLEIVGAYAGGRDWDLCRGEPEKAQEVRANIARVPRPERDPVTGADW